MESLNAALGERLRRARRARGWSLLEVEEATDGEFKASVLGAYERGERSLSVARLCRLAELYHVSPSALLPGVADIADGEPVVVDLKSAETMLPEQAETLDRYLSAIQVMRRDPAGPTLSVRLSDLKVLAALLDTDNPAEALERLAQEER
jgi:transcriptional regulator with XRE-family HTH domain